jgi:hypothetical protein
MISRKPGWYAGRRVQPRAASFFPQLRAGDFTLLPDDFQKRTF